MNNPSQRDKSMDSTDIEVAALQASHLFAGIPEGQYRDILSRGEPH